MMELMLPLFYCRDLNMLKVALMEKRTSLKEMRPQEKRGTLMTHFREGYSSCSSLKYYDMKVLAVFFYNVQYFIFKSK
ncbi:hypothetical protein ONE63_003533 [Megalurothrips usitatus]|uniref:Uncharacterized protein n=1 Tax=Megalurothrips usitatus TaxID=439358 RepID=A0AAV7X6E4_9NEOP|nr:hypothetical protein ONE63_003533 [Megalurothrips usitatus]